jgi:hypothetical protein
MPLRDLELLDGARDGVWCGWGSNRDESESSEMEDIEDRDETEDREDDKDTESDVASDSELGRSSSSSDAMCRNQVHFCQM